jgi:hypothetical protein
LPNLVFSASNCAVKVVSKVLIPPYTGISVANH